MPVFLFMLKFLSLISRLNVLELKVTLLFNDVNFLIKSKPNIPILLKFWSHQMQDPLKTGRFFKNNIYAQQGFVLVQVCALRDIEMAV